jgi:hypothetical protein
MTSFPFSTHDNGKPPSAGTIGTTCFKVGYYRPTYAFQHIDEFMGIIDTDGQLVAVTGPSTSREAALNAKLFACSPQLLQQLKSIYEALQKTAEFPVGDDECDSIQNAGLWMKDWLTESQHLLKQLENYPN